MASCQTAELPVKST